MTRILASNQGNPARELAAGLALLVGSVASAANLAATVDNIKEYKGKVRVTVYPEATWLNEDPEKAAGLQSVGLTGQTANGSVSLNFDLEPGEYAAVAYHDLNDNAELDRNFVGIPKEPYAFSQGFDKMRRPTFEDCKFAVGEEGHAITIDLR